MGWGACTGEAPKKKKKKAAEAEEAAWRVNACVRAQLQAPLGLCTRTCTSMKVKMCVGVHECVLRSRCVFTCMHLHAQISVCVYVVVYINLSVHVETLLKSQTTLSS